MLEKIFHLNDKLASDEREAATLVLTFRFHYEIPPEKITLAARRGIIDA
jgi:hypothetical protein